MFPVRRQLLITVIGLSLSTTPAAATLLTNAASPDTTPTYDSSGQVVEPDVLYVPGGWHGYHYWMAVTPYTCSDERHENPSILASNNGRNWVTPTDGNTTAPAPLVPGGQNCSYAFVNNDPSIVMVDDVMYMYYMVEYRSQGPTCPDSINVFRISTSDGVNWSQPENLVWGDAAFHYEHCYSSSATYKLSQSVVYKDGTWYMWYVDYPASAQCGSSAQIHRMSSTDGVHWPTANNVTCTMSSQQGYPFHLTVKYYAGSYEMLYTACGSDHNLYYATSSNGTSWTSNTTAVLSPGSTWDDLLIYRSGFTGKYPNIAVFYNAASTTNCTNPCSDGSGPTWHEGFASTGDYLPPATIHDLDFKRMTTSTVTLRWTAPGDDENTGRATSYSFRYYTSPITDGNWSQAWPVTTGSPDSAGVQDTVKVTSLSQNVWYYFAIKATDDVGNESWLSNVACIKLGHPFEICEDGGGGFAMRRVFGDPEPDDPTIASLGIRSVLPNPAREGVDVSYALPTGAAATLELIDVAGRMLRRVPVDGVAGTHVVHLDLSRVESRGMTFVRLRQGAMTVSRPIVLLH